MPELSRLIAGMKRSGIREIMDLVMGVKDIVRLEAGEPLFSTPSYVTDAACESAKSGCTKYTLNAGILSLRQAIAERLNKDYELKLTTRNVVITAGGVGAISSAVRALVDEGDNVLIPDPGWPNYEMAVTCAGAVPHRYQLDPTRGFLPVTSNLASIITPRTKAIIINSPSNPLGTVFSEDLVKELVEFARRRDLFIISDEVYEKIIFEGKHSSALSFDTDGRVIGVFSFSKTYAMTGWRVGYVVADESIATQIAKVQEVYVSCVSSVSQKAAEAAVLSPQDCVENMCRTYQKNLNVAREILDRHGINYQMPRGAFYLWIDVKCKDSSAFAKKLLIEEKVAVAPGSTFGPSGRHYIRISLASPQESIQEGLTRLTSFLKR